jgi:serine/threonine protein kinase
MGGMTSHFDRLAKSLSTTYRLRSTLGSGGAAHVYVADELKTGRRVAIKVLREEQATSISVSRFLAEIRIAAELEHPNIVPVYGSGTADGLPYYVMPFIEGQSLRTRLSSAGRLPLAEVLCISADISAALDYAHKRRVVHRDIKPENVLLHSGRALVVDFGIALALDAIEHPRRTMPGSEPGTPYYMSPEQAQGDMEIDGRSDVYGLACLVYEMIWGHPPFTGAPAIVLLRQIAAEPMPLGCRLPGLPHGLSAAVSRALAKAPAQRFATAGAFVAALRGASETLESCRAGEISSADEVTPFEEAFQLSSTKVAQADVDEIRLRIAKGLHIARMQLSRVLPNLPGGIGKSLSILLFLALAGALWIHFEPSFEAITGLGRIGNSTAFDVVSPLSIVVANGSLWMG